MPLFSHRRKTGGGAGDRRQDAHLEAAFYAAPSKLRIAAAARVSTQPTPNMRRGARQPGVARVLRIRAPLGSTAK